MNFGRNIIDDKGHPNLFAKVLSGAFRDYKDGILDISTPFNKEGDPKTLVAAEDGVWLCNRLVAFVDTGENGFDVGKRDVNYQGLTLLGYGLEKAGDGLFYFVGADEDSIKTHLSFFNKNGKLFVGSRFTKYKSVFNSIHPDLVAKEMGGGFMKCVPRSNKILGRIDEVKKALAKNGQYTIKGFSGNVASTRTYLWNNDVKGLSFNRVGGDLVIKVDGITLEQEIDLAREWLRDNERYQVRKNYKTSYVYQYVSANAKDLLVEFDGKSIYLKTKPDSLNFGKEMKQMLDALILGDETELKFTLVSSDTDKEAARMRAIISTNYPRIFTTRLLRSNDNLYLLVQKKGI
jgi:hypothetical protein